MTKFGSPTTPSSAKVRELREEKIISSLVFFLILQTVPDIRHILGT
jgi:hypothetical protein